jgi:hypothetical protein
VNRPKALVVAVLTFPIESVIDTVAFRRPCKSGVATRPLTVAIPADWLRSANPQKPAWAETVALPTSRPAVGWPTVPSTLKLPPVPVPLPPATTVCVRVNCPPVATWHIAPTVMRATDIIAITIFFILSFLLQEFLILNPISGFAIPTDIPLEPDRWIVRIAL